MSNKSAAFLPKLEIIIMVVFFLAFTFWAISRCNATREKYRQEAEAASAEEMTEAEQAALAAVDSIEEEAPVEPVGAVDRGTPLFVTIDGLNMRAEPTLNSGIILRLDLYEEVYFQNEVTSFRDSISLGGIMAYEPWVKIKHRKGRVGWVYGAGVHYYKMKLPGVR